MRLNTGFVRDSFNTVALELHTSDYIWVDGNPVIRQNNDLQFKTNQNEKLVQYEWEFMYANPINAVL